MNSVLPQRRTTAPPSPGRYRNHHTQEQKHNLPRDVLALNWRQRSGVPLAFANRSWARDGRDSSVQSFWPVCASVNLLFAGKQNVN